MKLPEWYRVDWAAGVDFVSFDNALADGASCIINTRTGNFEVLGADGLVYFNGPNGLVPKAGGTLAVLAEAERRIAGAKEAAAVNELVRLSERAVQVRPELNIGSGRNIAVAEYSIDGRSAELVGVSGLAKRSGTVDVPEKQVFDTIQTGNNPRTMGSEYKILSNLADKLTPSSQRVVNIYSEPQSACHAAGL